MLHEFLDENRLELIDRCRARVAQRLTPEPSDAQIEHGIPHFLDQLIRTLQVEQKRDAARSLRISGSADGMPDHSEIGATAALHARDLLQNGYSVHQVVHDYGDLCQAISDVAIELRVSIEVEEFRTLNRCLDNAIAEAVAAFSSLKDSSNADRDTRTHNERMGMFAHEMRNSLNTVSLAFAAIKSGRVGLDGATSAALERGLLGLRSLIEHSLADVRLAAAICASPEIISVAALIADVKDSASLDAWARNCAFRVTEVDPELAADANQSLLASAVGNLLQNAFKFTRPGTEVSLTVRASADRVLIEVADHCGGLPPGATANMFVPFTQSGTDKSGLGLGLSICKRCIEASDGTLSVRDVPGTGCIFTISLPRHALPNQRRTTLPGLSEQA